jgi:hypothetical protein
VDAKSNLWLGAIAVPFISLAGCTKPDGDAAESTDTSSGEASDETQANTSGADLLACEPAQTPDLELIMEPGPPEEGPDDSFEFHGSCTVESVGDTPVSLSLACETEGETVSFSLTVNGLAGAELAQEFQVDDAVELDYATLRGVFQSPAWAAVRHGGESAPALVAVRSWQPLPWFDQEPEFMSPFVLRFLANTDCEESPGSCNVGPKRRAAVEFSADGQDFSVIFDRNESEVGSYRVSVGEASVDEGNCEGVNETWYEIVISRTHDG